MGQIHAKCHPNLFKSFVHSTLETRCNSACKDTEWAKFQAGAFNFPPSYETACSDKRGQQDDSISLKDSTVQVEQEKVKRLQLK